MWAEYNPATLLHAYLDAHGIIVSAGGDLRAVFST
jgi:hypothetical protein